ncbi:MAG: hypothetical protein GX636_01110 [Actinomycetales bacterium]|nr:hypothetical protein [Actinomycetales bacterium]
MMSAPGIRTGTSPFAGIGLMVRIALTTGWLRCVLWVLGPTLLYLVTGASIAALYDTPEKVATYGASIGDSMIMLTGRIAGLDTLGGVLANEFASVASFAIPIMAIALTVGFTRKEEESGRTELLTAGRVGRLAPTAAGLVVVTGIFVVLGAAIWAVTLGFEVDRRGAALYAASLVTTGWVYTAATAVLAQVFAHARTVWFGALTLFGVTLATRGVGDLRRSWLSWTSPLGWQGQVRPFGDPSPAGLVVAVVATVGLAALALWLAGRRDVGAGLVPPRTGPASASRWRASAAGTAVHQHLGATVAWTIGVVALMGLYGGLMNIVVEAIRSNPALAVFLGDAGSIVDSIVQMLLVFVGFLGAAYALQTLGGLRGEETAGRLEVMLAPGRSRSAWLAAHIAVVLTGTVVVVLAGSAAFAVSSAAVLGDPALVGRILGAGAWQAVSAVSVAALSIGLFGMIPRLQALAWVVFAVAVVVTFMGPSLRLTADQMRLSPFGAVGTAPTGPVDVTGVVVLLAVSTALVTVGLLGFRRRDVPKT